MAAKIKVLNSLEGTQAAPTYTFSMPVKSGAASSIKAGYLVVKDGSNAGYVAAAADETASTAVILGVAVSDSTDTASADGTVDIVTAPVLTVAIKAETPGDLAATKLFAKYTLTVDSGAYLLDEGTTTNGIFRLVSYDNTTDGNCIATLATNW